MAYLFLNAHQQQLDGARRQIELLTNQRHQLLQNLAAIDQQIAQYGAVVAALTPIVAHSAANQLQGTSLADLCRLALNAYGGEWVSAQLVRSYLVQLGVRLQYNNEMAVLHNTLKRVGRSAKDSFGNTVYAPSL